MEYGEKMMSLLCERSRERLDCFVHGHRVSGAAVYAGVEPDEEHDEELHYCEVCGSPVWVSVPHEAPGSRRWIDEDPG